MNAFMVELKNWLPGQNRFGRRLLFCLTLSVVLLGAQSPEAAITPDGQPGWFIDMGSFAASAHGTFSCEQCHGDMKQGQNIHPDSENPLFLKGDANRQYDYKRCSACHKPVFEQYLIGAHAKALLKQQTDPPDEYNQLPENKKAPTCGHCHSSHYVKSHLSRVEIGRGMVSVCGACHPAQSATYLDNYHGKAAVNLGDKNAAFCTDCHGAHHCRSLKDKKEALATCKRCHPEATEGFTQVVIHNTTRDLPENDKEKRAHVALIRVVTILMTILVLLVVGFFYGHSFVWILRELHEKLRKHK
jgi:ribosomal protein L31